MLTIKCPKIGYWYITTICDNRCQHCKVRANKPGEADYDVTIATLEEFGQLGGRYVDLTGGNPLLVPWLGEALQICGESSLLTSLTVSGPKIAVVDDEILKLPTWLRFSIDGNGEYHNHNRGSGYIDYVVEGLRRAKALRDGKRIQLLFTVIPGAYGNINADHFAYVLRLAREYGVLVNVNPLFNIRELTVSELKDLRWFADQADVQCSLGKMRFLLRGGNNIANPTCRAGRDVVTVSSDGMLVTPCYHHSQARISLDDGLEVALKAKERVEIVNRDGRFDFCEGCSIWCYIVPSWFGHITDRVVVWLHSLSGLQTIRDSVLKGSGRLHKNCPYPEFEM